MSRQSSHSPFDALVFDVGGVLVAHENRLIHERLASRCETQPALTGIAARLRNRKWDKGEARIRDLHEELRRDIGYQGTWTDFLDDWCCHFTPDSSMLAFVDDLTHDHRVILFSNTNKVHWDFLERHCPIGGFERFLSHEMGLSKPDIKSFAYVAETASIAPARSLFFDDLPENVDGAHAAGFQAEVFLGQSWLEGFLADAGVHLPRHRSSRIA